MSRCYALRIEKKTDDCREVEYFVRSTVDELIRIAKDAWLEIHRDTVSICEYIYDSHRKLKLGLLPVSPKSRTDWQLRNDERFEKYYQEYVRDYEKLHKNTRSRTLNTQKAKKYAKNKLFDD